MDIQNARYKIEEIEINSEFKRAIELTEKTNESFFLTGKAGTGKSTFIKYITEHLYKSFLILAPTGIAAINAGGVTIHSFFQIPFNPIPPDSPIENGLKIFQKKSEKRKIIANIDTVIVDEISMVRADIIDAMDFSLRENGGFASLPFGGKQMIFVGDLFQLEPVTIKDTGERAIIEKCYKTPYFFSAKIFEKVELPSISLEKSYRHKNDTKFLDILNEIRINQLSKTSKETLNSRVILESFNDENKTTLCTKNELVNRKNLQKLNAISNKEFVFEAEIHGIFKNSRFPADEFLSLKEDARVIFVKNDSDKRWFNGTLGKITSLSSDQIEVTTDSGKAYDVKKAKWEDVKYVFNTKTGVVEQEIVGTFIQYPIRLAWAITIHKSQGLTFDELVVDLAEGTFASGQTYVALSRCRTLQGLYLKRPLNSNDVIVDERIIEFSKNFNNTDSFKKSLESKSNLLFQYAKFYHAMGFNVFCLDKQINQFFSKELIKSPTQKWQSIYYKRQTLEELQDCNWQNSNGLAIVFGFYGLTTDNDQFVIDNFNGSKEVEKKQLKARCIAVYDCYSNSTIKELVKSLELPEDYEWIVKSRNKNDYYIIFSTDYYCTKDGLSNVFAFMHGNMSNAKFSKIEFIWNGFLVLPPSTYPLGNRYKFRNEQYPLTELKVVEHLALENTRHKIYDIAIEGEVGQISDCLIVKPIFNQIVTGFYDDEYTDFVNSLVGKFVSELDYNKIKLSDIENKLDSFLESTLIPQIKNLKQRIENQKDNLALVEIVEDLKDRIHLLEQALAEKDKITGPRGILTETIANKILEQDIDAFEQDFTKNAEERDIKLSYSGKLKLFLASVPLKRTGTEQVVTESISDLPMYENPNRLILILLSVYTDIPREMSALLKRLEAITNCTKIDHVYIQLYEKLQKIPVNKQQEFINALNLYEKYSNS